MTIPRRTCIAQVFSAAALEKGFVDIAALLREHGGRETL
jgi:hypothetical protein